MNKLYFLLIACLMAASVMAQHHYEGKRQRQPQAVERHHHDRQAGPHDKLMQAIYKR